MRPMSANPTRLAFVALLTMLLASTGVWADPVTSVMTRDAQANITPAKALTMLKEGNARFVSGNATDYDYIAQVKQTAKGQFPFASKLAGSKLIVVMGHTECGAVKGACDAAQIGLLSTTLASINPAVTAVEGYSPRSSKNAEFVQAVSEKNVRLTMKTLRDRSVVLRQMIDSGDIDLVGAMYDVSTGEVTFLSPQAMQ